MATYESILRGQGWRLQVCGTCGCSYRWEVGRTNRGKGPTPETADEAAARAIEVSILDPGAELACPQCGHYPVSRQEARRARLHRWLALLGPIAILGSLGLFVGLGLDATAGLAILSVSCLILLLHALVMTISLRGNPDSNRQRLRKAVAQGELVVESESDGQTVAPAARRAIVPRMLAFAVMFLPIATLCIGEVVRWRAQIPLNPRFRPSQIGLGDRVTLYYSKNIESVNKLWTGKATVEVLNATELGLAQSTLEASTRQQDWGIEIKSTKAQNEAAEVYVEFRIPESERLLGKTLQLRIRNEIKYPSTGGQGFFGDVAETLEENVEIKLPASQTAHILSKRLQGYGFVGALAASIAGGLWLGHIAHKSGRAAAEVSSQLVGMEWHRA